MTKRKHLKGRARSRAAKTGESYSTALRNIRARQKEDTTMSSQTTGLVLSCSFCKKSSDAVKKLIAGPGVYICDECIGLCNNILTTEEQDRAPSLDDAPVDRLLSILRGTALTAADIEAQLRARALSLRGRGASVEQIADAAGLTPEEAVARFEL